MTKPTPSDVSIPIAGPHGGPERRAVARVLHYWRVLAGERGLPALADLPLGSAEAAAGEGMWPNLFVATAPENIADSLIIYGGAVLARACGLDPSGQRAVDCLPPSLWERMEYLFEASATWKKPLMGSGPFVTREGTNALHRSIVMPLGDDEETVRNLLGGFSFTPTER